MRRIAIQSLLHDRGKFLAALAGVSFAATLVLVQVGLYAGFLSMASGIIRRTGGDLWVMPRGIEVIDNSEPMSGAARAVARSHPCVRRVRGMIYTFMPVRKPRGTPDAVTLVGYEPADDPVVPWTLHRGLPRDLHGPLRAAVDHVDLRKLQIEGDALGSTLQVNGHTVRIAATTAGMRSFTLVPFLFAEIQNARRIMHVGEDRASYWVVDLRDPRCADDVAAHIGRHTDLQAISTPRFAELTENHWVRESGAGSALGFTAVLGLVVGVVIVGQTLYAVTREHLRELATLKAIGGTDAEIVRFVAWQAALLASLGGGIGVLISFAVREGISTQGLVVILSGEVLALGLGAVLAMCLVASVWSVRAVLQLEAAEVFR
jgi:putative ABC transport system permease protein